MNKINTDTGNSEYGHFLRSENDTYMATTTKKTPRNNC